jgi:hypothetical protein
LWAFDINGVFRRSLACEWIRGCTSPYEANAAIARNRSARSEGSCLRGREVLPQWHDDESKVVFVDCHKAAGDVPLVDAVTQSDEADNCKRQHAGSCRPQ